MRHLPEQQETDASAGPDPRWRLLLLLIARSTPARVLGALLASGGVGAGLFVTHLYTEAVSPTCDEIPLADLDIPAIVALKNRVELYQKDPYPSAELAMDAPEFNFILRDRDHAYQAHVEVHGDQAVIHAAMPRADGTCYNIRYAGGIDIQDRVATLHAEQVIVGTADLTWWFDRESGVQLTADDMPDPLSRAQLENMEELHLRGGEVVIRLLDRWTMW